MCGLVGIIQGNSKKRLHHNVKPLASWFYQGLFADTLRGNDGTGVIAVNSQLETFKKGIPGDSFVHEPWLNRTLNDIEDQDILFGHNRAATKGGVSSSSAHPFTWTRKDGTRLSGVHNGTLRMWNDLKHYKTCDVDSDALFGEITESGPEEAAKKLVGAFALLWYDESTEEAYVMRNSERPLCFGWCKELDAVLIASEGKMLDWLADRNNIKIDSIEEVEAGKLYTFNPYDYEKTLKETMVSKEVEFYTYEKKRTGGRTMGYWDIDRVANPIGATVNLSTLSWVQYQNDTKGLGVMRGRTTRGINFKVFGVSRTDFHQKMSGNMLSAVIRGYGEEAQSEFLRCDGVKKKGSVSAAARVKSATSLYQGPDETYISLANWRVAAKGGCSGCGDPLDPAEDNDIVWYKGANNKDEALCPSCVTEFEQSVK